MLFAKYNSPILYALTNMCGQLSQQDCTRAISLLPLFYAKLNPVSRSASSVLNPTNADLERNMNWYLAGQVVSWVTPVTAVAATLGYLATVAKVNHSNRRQNSMAKRVQKFGQLLLQERPGTLSDAIRLFLLGNGGVDRPSAKFTLVLICMTLLQMREENVEIADDNYEMFFARFAALEAQFAKSHLTPEMVVALATPPSSSVSRLRGISWETLCNAINGACQTYINDSHFESERRVEFFSKTVLPLLRSKKLAARIPGVTATENAPYFSFDRSALIELSRHNVDYAIIHLLTGDGGQTNEKSFKNILVSNLIPIAPDADENKSFFMDPLYIAGELLREHMLGQQLNPRLLLIEVAPDAQESQAQQSSPR